MQVTSGTHVALRARVLSAGATDIGLYRDQNEDRFALWPEVGLYVVADGMGGTAGGEVAAQIATSTLSEPFWNEHITLPPSTDLRETGGLLRASIRRTNGMIYQTAKSRQLPGMGTTLAALLLTIGPDGVEVAVVAHVGDARVYRLRAGQLEQLTKDHSFVFALLAAGQITAEQAETHPERHTVSRALGPLPDVKVDMAVHPLELGDTFLLCSDGLHGPLGSAAIRDALVKSGSLEATVEELIHLANDAGGPDNITVALVRWDVLRPDVGRPPGDAAA